MNYPLSGGSRGSRVNGDIRIFLKFDLIDKYKNIIKNPP